MKARDAYHLYADACTPQGRWARALWGCLGSVVLLGLFALGAHLDAVDDSSPEVQQLAEAERKRLAMVAQQPHALPAYEQGLLDATVAMQSVGDCGHGQGR